MRPVSRTQRRGRSRRQCVEAWSWCESVGRASARPTSILVSGYGTTMSNATLLESALSPPAVNVYVLTSNWVVRGQLFPSGCSRQYADRLLPLDSPHSTVTTGVDPASVTPPEGVRQ